MNTLRVTGFDSAWGGIQRGAVCDLWVDKPNRSIQIKELPASVLWEEILSNARAFSDEHHIVAIDQGLIVPNESGMRPVERTLAAALGDMRCSAYPSNRSNRTCYGPTAGIWRLLHQLDEMGFTQNPMSVPQSEIGKFYLECYPHPAILGLFGAPSILKYKCRHRNSRDWDALQRHLGALPVNGLPAVLRSLARQDKANEDKLDAIICAYVGVLWWLFGTEQCSMLGDIDTGYIITPHNETTLKRFSKTFGKSMNGQIGNSPGMRGKQSQPLPTQPFCGDRKMTVPAPDRDTEEWSGPVELIATDTTNLWRNRLLGKRSTVINPWMDESRFAGHRLIVKLLDEDGEPEIEFLPFAGHVKQAGMKNDRACQPGVWDLLVAGARARSPLHFPALYRYETI